MLNLTQIREIIDNYESIKEEVPKIRQSFLKREFVKVFNNALSLFLEQNLENRDINTFIKNYVMKMIAHEIILYNHGYLTMLSADLDCQDIFNKVVKYYKVKSIKDIDKLKTSMYILVDLILLEELLTSWIHSYFRGKNIQLNEENIKELKFGYEDIKKEVEQNS